MARIDQLDPLLYFEEWPSLRSAYGRVDVHSLAVFWARESRLEGHYFEFGVGRGRSAISAIRAAKKHNRQYQFHLFDSFQGLPALKGRDSASTQFHERQYAYGTDDVIEFFKRYDIEKDDNIFFHEGAFEDFDRSVIRDGTLASIVHVDCDLYHSALDALRCVGPYLQHGTIMLFDDYNAFMADDDFGQRRAAEDWMQEVARSKIEGKAPCRIVLTPYVDYGWHGRGFICHFSDHAEGSDGAFVLPKTAEA